MSEDRPSVAIPRYRVTVFANETAQSNEAAFQAEQSINRFFETFKLQNRVQTYPIILSLDHDSNSSDHATVRIFIKNESIKIQTFWSQIPISRFAFHRGCIRSLCTRFALENIASNLPSDDTPHEIFIPHWLTDGLALLTTESDTLREFSDRASLLARTEPDLTLQQVFQELDACSNLNSNQQAIALVICQSLAFDFEVRKRLFANLCRIESTQNMAWLKSILPGRNLVDWWKEVWSKQALILPASRLSFNSSIKWILFKKMEFLFKKTRKTALETQEAKVEVIPVLSPWLDHWIQQLESFDPSQFSKPELKSSLSECQQWRRSALDWFSSIDCPKHTLRQLISLECSFNSVDSYSLASGPAMRWFANLKTP